VVAAIGVVAVDIGKLREFWRRKPSEALSPRSPQNAANDLKWASEAQKVGSGRSPDDERKPRSFRQTIRHLHPYYCLVLLAGPAAVVEPLKMTGLVETGRGHWPAGLAILAAAYALSFLLVNRLFRIVQPRLLALPWFRRSRRKILRFRRRCLTHMSGYNGSRKAEASGRIGSTRSATHEQPPLGHPVSRTAP
jgi:hypothetical protein